MTEFTRRTSDTPGQFGRLNYYWPHSSGLSHVAVWRQPGSYQDAPVAIFVHGQGFGCEPGWGSMTDQGVLRPGSLKNLAQSLYDRGYVIVSIDYPTCSRNIIRQSPYEARGGFRIFGSWRERHPIALWPEQPKYVGLATQFVKSNWSGVSGPTITEWGAQLWGAGNSIDPSKVVLCGDKHGALMAMFVALQPTGYLAFERGLSHEAFDPYTPRASHRVAALVLRDPGPIDFTQFWVLPTYGEINGNLPEEFSADRYCIAMRCESARKWGSGDYSTMPLPSGGTEHGRPLVLPLSGQWKRTSPWWVLQENHVENANLPMHVEISGTGYASYDNLLTSSDWSPGTQRSNQAGNKCWQQPWDGRIQGPPLRAALEAYGGPSATAAAIRKSVVRDPVTTAWPILADSAYASSVVSWLSQFDL